MADENPTDCAERIPLPADEDAKTEMAVLAFVLDEHPTQLTIPELSRALNASSEDFGAFDSVERAIRQLDGAGPLNCKGGMAVPSRAALYFARLSDVELATLTWVDWFNHRRLHGACGDLPPVEFEANYLAELSPQ